MNPDLGEIGESLNGGGHQGGVAFRDNGKPESPRLRPVRPEILPRLLRSRSNASCRLAASRNPAIPSESPHHVGRQASQTRFASPR